MKWLRFPGWRLALGAALLIAAAVAFTVLVQMALLDNWLEVTRVTFVAWILLAVGAKEVSARSTQQPA